MAISSKVWTLRINKIYNLHAQPGYPERVTMDEETVTVSTELYGLALSDTCAVMTQSLSTFRFIVNRI